MPWARTPLSLNARLGWAATNRARQDITEAVAWATRGVEPHRTPVEVEIIRYLGGDGVADPDNLAATLKPTIDALVPRVLPTDDARTVVRTAQRVIPAERDPLGLGHPRLLLVITEARPDEFEHYGAAGEVTGWA